MKIRNIALLLLAAIALGIITDAYQARSNEAYFQARIDADNATE